MQTPIGNHLRTPRRRVAAAIVAAGVVLTDALLVRGGDSSYSGPRAALPVIGLISLLLLSGGDLASLGLTFRLGEGSRYWIRATPLIGACVGAVVLVVAAYFVVLGIEIPITGVPLALVPPLLLRMCLAAPLVEELTYRLVLCTAAAVILPPRGAIALSGSAFAALHVLYGNPGPDNLVAGFFLAWAYLKSGTILMPIALHAVGNLCVLIAWVGLWYWRLGISF